MLLGTTHLKGASKGCTDKSIKYRNHLGNDLIFMVYLCQVFIIRSVSPLSCILDSPYLVHTLMTEGTCPYFFICNLNLIAVPWYFDLISFWTKFQTQKNNTIAGAVQAIHRNVFTLVSFKVCVFSFKV